MLLQQYVKCGVPGYATPGIRVPACTPCGRYDCTYALVRVVTMLFVDPPLPPFILCLPRLVADRLWLQIKWITDIEVTDLESDNHYHYFDNRVLPSQARTNELFPLLSPLFTCSFRDFLREISRAVGVVNFNHVVEAVTWSLNRCYEDYPGLVIGRYFTPTIAQ